MRSEEAVGQTKEMSLLPFENDTEWRIFVGRFDAGTLTKEDWTHPAHLCVGAWFVSHFEPVEAGMRIRNGIRHLNECLGNKNTETSGFHETLTEFWIRAIRAHLAVHGTSMASLDLLVALPTGLWRESYSVDLPKDLAARHEYLEPS